MRLLRAHGLVLRSVRRRLPAGLTLPQFDVLAQLHRHPDGLLPSELTEALLVTAGNVTGIVKRLESQGVVERSRVPDDRRAVRVQLTERGRLAHGRPPPAHARALEEILGRVPRLISPRCARGWARWCARWRDPVRPDPQSFRYEEEGGVATLRLDRPEVMNALTFEVYRELTETFRALAQRPQVRAVVLTGTGRAFCTGGDVRDIIGELVRYDGPACSRSPASPATSSRPCAPCPGPSWRP